MLHREAGMDIRCNQVWSDLSSGPNCSPFAMESCDSPLESFIESTSVLEQQILQLLHLGTIRQWQTWMACPHLIQKTRTSFGAGLSVSFSFYRLLEAALVILCYFRCSRCLGCMESIHNHPVPSELLCCRVHTS